MNCLQRVFLFCFVGFHAAVAEKVLYARDGDDVQLNFLHESNKYIDWFVGDEQIAWFNTWTIKFSPGWTDRLSWSPSALVIKNVTQRDFGLYSCVVKDKFKKELSREYFRLIQLNVAVEPSVVLPGEWLTLSCSVSSQVPAPQIHWINPQGQKMDRRVQVQAAALHSGHWTFVVSDGGKENTGRVKVTVIDLLPPAPAPTFYTSTSSPLTVPCSLSANTSWEQVKSKGVLEVGWTFCPPNLGCDGSALFSLSLEDKLTWKKLTDRMLRPSLSPSTGNLSLARKLGREADAGDYKCLMKFQNGRNVSRTVRVEVLQIISSPGTKLTEGQQLNLTCTTGHPLPPGLRVQWFPPKKASSPSVSPPMPLHPSASHILIPSVGQAEAGTWRCELKRGEERLTSAVVELRIEWVMKISVWMLVTLCAAAAILILLVVLFVIVRRRKQRRTRRHMRLCNCKNPKPKGFYRS